MEVVPSKHFQFKPVVLYLPGYESDDKNWTNMASTQLFKQDPELWKTFRRMAGSQSRTPEHRLNCNFAPPTVTYPDKGGMKCMCYENLMSIIRERMCISPPCIFRVPNGKPTKITLESVRPSWTKRAMQGFRDNEKLQYPLPTITVRWQFKQKLPKYDTNTLRNFLAPYGEIRDILISSPNSCLVIFKEISAACRVTQARCLGYPTNKLHCTWWHSSMKNKSLVARAKGLSVKTDNFIK